MYDTTICNASASSLTSSQGSNKAIIASGPEMSPVTAGSVNSWLAGNFNYNISNAFLDVAQVQLSVDDATHLAKLSVTQDTAGFFDLPVCKVGIPNATAGTRYANSEWALPSLCLFLLTTFHLPSSSLQLPSQPSPPQHTHNVIEDTHADPPMTHSSLRLRLRLYSRRYQKRPRPSMASPVKFKDVSFPGL